MRTGRIIGCLLVLTVAVVSACDGEALDASGSASGAGGAGGAYDSSSGSSGGSASTDPNDYEGPGGDYYYSGMDASSGGMDTGGVPEEPEPLDDKGDKYEDPGTNPFVLAAHDPLSTFATDVDTASYDLFRRDILEGFLPSKESVRIEEYVNFFAYGYEAPAPDSDIPFAISLEAAPSPATHETTLLRVGIKGRVPPPEEKKAANLVFLVDVSGSMSASNKLPLVKVILKEALKVLDPTDRLSIVTYAGSTEVVLPSTPISSNTTIVSAIDNLGAGGSTWGAGGIELAYKQAEAGFIEGGINHVLLCTDGDFNVGASGNDELVKLIEEKRKSGITLTVLGFGIGNLNDSMMEAITNAGNGTYSVIADEDQAIDYVHDRLLSNLVYIAKDVKIQVELNPALVHAYRLLGYENRAIADNDFKNDKVDAGEIGAGHTVTALYELVLTGDDIPMAEGAPPAEDGAEFDGELEVAATDLCLVKVRYKDVDATEEDPARQVDAGLAAADVKESLQGTSGDFKWAAAIAAFAEILKESVYADPSLLPTIEELVTTNAGSDPDRKEFLSLFGGAKTLLSK